MPIHLIITITIIIHFSYFQFDTAKSYQNEKCQVHAILSLASQLSQWSCLGDLRSHSFRPLHFGKFSMN